MLPEKLQKKLNDREKANALRKLVNGKGLIDFSSNDYLGFSNSENIFDKTHEFLVRHNIKNNGSTGSRLLTGNHSLYNLVENILCDFHRCDAALVFNSGYDANIGFFSSIPQRDDIILYDEYIHASIRDGISIGKAKAFKFKHNDLDNLEKMLEQVQHVNIYIVTESVFSMDGDVSDLIKMSKLCKKYNALLVVDEAHAVGVFGENGKGLVKKLNLEKDIFARLVTFGKALGCHGAAILGSSKLRNYLLNFARSFVYTTALPPHSLATIYNAYNELISINGEKAYCDLNINIEFFKTEINRLELQSYFIISDSAIQSCIVQGNEKVKSISENLQTKGFNVRAILAPTVPLKEERLRFCIHSFNTKKEISEVLEQLSQFLR